MMSKFLTFSPVCVCVSGSIGIIVPLVLLVLIVATITVGLFICKRHQRSEFKTPTTNKAHTQNNAACV